METNKPTNDNQSQTRWDPEKGRYTESGKGIIDERQTDDLEKELDPGNFDGDVSDESLTNDEK